MELKIKTLTPIWTGDVEKKSTKLRETSVIGSLRWWFEAIVRGLGGYACDSVGEVNEKCEYRKGEKPKDSICPVCYVFGTTGWGRRFRLEIDENSYQIISSSLATDGLKCKAPRNVRWWLSKVLGGYNPLVIEEKTNDGVVLYVTVSDSVVEEILYFTFKIIQNIGALGSHNSYGFGIVKVLEPTNFDIDKALGSIEQYCEKWKMNKKENSPLLPNLKYAFKIDYRLSSELHDKNIGFLMKYTLRNKFKNKYNKDFAEQLFGSKKDRSEKFSGRIFVSNCWQEEGEWLFRVYGMLPPRILGKRKREDILNTIEECVNECLDAEIISEVDLGEIEYLNTELKKLVVKDEI